MAGTRSAFSYYVGTSKSRSKSIWSVYFISCRLTDIVTNDIKPKVLSLSKKRKVSKPIYKIHCKVQIINLSVSRKCPNLLLASQRKANR